MTNKISPELYNLRFNTLTQFILIFANFVYRCLPKLSVCYMVLCSFTWLL